MAKYTYAQLEQIWITAGGNPIRAPMAAAIAMAESGGDPLAFNQADPSGGSRGLWQINGVHGAQSSFDTMTNARAAVAISNNGTSWQPWGAFTNGSYRQFLNPNVKPDPNVNVNGTAQTVADTFGTANNPGGTQAETVACSTLEQIISPALCIAGGSNPVTKSIAGIIQGLVAAIVNPLLTIASGTLGILGGAILMMVGLQYMLKTTEVGRDTAAVGSMVAKGALE